MPEVAIRPALSSDMPSLTSFGSSFQTGNVWQMDRALEEGHLGVNFREIRLPRPVKVEYPRHQGEIFDENWMNQQVILVALLDGNLAGYARVSDRMIPKTAWVKDVVVREENRRKGVGTALILAAQDWGMERNCRRIIVEMQSKNFPAIQLIRKLGYEFCGYSDQYYLNQDIALFFARMLR
jgi:GNAT superfamily N-acetyltransferase